MNIGAPFDLLIMDLNIPDGMGAIETVAEVIKLDKDAITIIASGDAMDPAMLHHEDYGFAACLAKPFEFAKLHTILAKVLTP